MNHIEEYFKELVMIHHMVNITRRERFNIYKISNNIKESS